MVHNVVVYSQFLYYMVLTSQSSTKSSQQLLQQVNNGSEVKYGVFKVKVQV